EACWVSIDWPSCSPRITSSINTAITDPTSPSRSRSDKFVFSELVSGCEVELQAMREIEMLSSASRNLSLTSAPLFKGIGGGVWESNPTGRSFHPGPTDLKSAPVTRPDAPPRYNFQPI